MSIEVNGMGVEGFQNYFGNISQLWLLRNICWIISIRNFDNQREKPNRIKLVTNMVLRAVYGPRQRGLGFKINILILLCRAQIWAV